ncbi:hypothetical protein [Streptomyces sp. SM8]|jgi:hypothetical protein|uniref:hypothetical protein n=1 Tax=Streptomyces sp. SM8 TaxID=1195457 RepID=UPI0002830EAF|nr:hypothetical protein [Streptomyces sp. SM8]
MGKEADLRSHSDTELAATAAGPVLELDDIAHESQGQLVARGTAYGREYEKVSGTATILLKNIAIVVIALRKQMDDWTGSSGEYREIVRQMYAAAGLDESAQSSVRYHVGNILRRTLTTRELESLGLKTTSPSERQQDARAANAALIAAARASAEVAPKKKSKGSSSASTELATLTAGEAVKSTADHLRLAQVARNIVNQVQPDVIKSEMTPGQRDRLDEELAEAQKRIAALRRVIRSTRD